MRHYLTIAIGSALLAGCATPSTRIATGLQRYGMDAGRAQCVGDRMQADLSIGQLQQIGRAAAAYRKGDSDPTALTGGDLLRVAAEIKDPAIALAVGKAAAACGVVI